MNRADVEHWLDRYRHAWSTDDPKDIAALFTEDATYSPYPWPRDERTWHGRDTIIEKWIGHGDAKAKWQFEHRIVAVDADTAVIEGWTTYAPTTETPYEDAYANIWVIRFADDGRPFVRRVVGPAPRPERGLITSALQRPLKLGSRFSRKAVIPSFWSSDEKSR